MASRPIDEKIVVMKMNNDQFKQKASETTSIFGKLRTSLSDFKTNAFNKVVTDINGITQASNKVDMNHINRSLDTITSRFSAMGVVAASALNNITNQAIYAGQNLAKSLTSAPVMSGFNEYELKMKSIGTILANTEWEGKNLDDVKKSLAVLNDYADNTIYSFAEMTSSIGRFTAAGVGLDDSQIAIKGLGNLAAISGSSVEQLNTAMYQVSQGLAAGRFGLEDWNSMVNAGMGGKKTQDALMATAKAMGKNIDMSDGFRLSLQQGWLTSDVFLATLRQFGEDESMTKAATSVRTFTGMIDALKEGVGSSWATTWEIVFGDFETATKFWTGISDTISGFFQKQGDARNNLLRAVFGDTALLGLLDRIKGIFTPIGQIFNAVGDSFKKVFAVKPENLRSIVDGFADLSEKMNLSDKTIKNISTIFTGLFSIIDIGINVIKSLASAFARLLPGVGAIGEGFLTLLAHIFKIPTIINKAIESSDQMSGSTSLLGKVLTGISDIIVSLVDNFMYLGSAVKQVAKVLLTGDYASGPFSDSSTIVQWTKSIREGFKNLFDYLGSIDISEVFNGIKAFFVGIKDGIVGIPDAISGIVDWFKNLFDLLADNQGWILAGGGLAGIAAVLWKIWEVFSAFTGPIGGFGDILENAGEAIGAFTLSIHAKSLVSVAVAIGLLAGSFLLLSNLEAEQISVGLYAIATSLGAVVGAMVILAKYVIADGGATGFVKATVAIAGIATSVLILSLALNSLSGLSWGEMTKGLIGLTTMLGALSGAAVVMSKYGSTFSVTAGQLVAISVGILLIVKAIEQIADIKVSDLIKGVTTIGVILAELGLFIRLASTQGATLGASAIAIVAVSGSILIMVKAIEEIAEIDAGALVKGLTAIGVILGALAGFIAIARGANLVSIGVSIGLLATALTLLIVPIGILGNMEFETLAKGIGAMAVSLGILATTATLMQGTLAGSAAMVLLAVAMNAIVVPIAAMGALPWEVVLLGIAGLAGGLAALAGVSILLSAGALPLLAFATAIGILGAAVALFGVGLSAAVSAIVLATTLTATAVSGFIAGMSALVPAFVDLFAKVMTATLNVIKEMAPKVIDGFVDLLNTILDEIDEHGPQLIEKIGNVLIKLLDSMISFVPKIVDFVVDFMIDLMKAITDRLPEFTSAGVDLITAFFDGLSKDIPKILDSMYQFMIDIVNGMSDTIKTNAPTLINAWMGLMGEVLKVVVTAGLSMINALFGWIPGVTEATTAIGETAYKYIDDNFQALDLATTKGTEFASGLSGTSALSATAGEAIAQAGLTGTKEVDASQGGKWFGEGFVTGMQNEGLLSRVGKAAKNLATKAYNALKEALDINSPSEETKELGMWSGVGFALGIEENDVKAERAFDTYLPRIQKATKRIITEVSKDGEEAGNASAQSMSDGFIEGLDKSVQPTTKEAKALATKVKKEFTEAMDISKYKFKMGTIDGAEHLKELESIKKSYAEYPELVRKANLEIRKVEDETYKERAEQRKAQFDADKALIDEYKNYNNLSLLEEYNAWEAIRQKYAEGTAERDEADLRSYQLKNDIYSKMKVMNEDFVTSVEEVQQREIDSIQKVNDEYESVLRSRTSELTNFKGIFEEMNKTEYVSGQKLLQNLKGQLTQLTTWSEEIQKLVARGLDDSLLKTLEEMGPNAINEITALNRLTDEELVEYVDIWKQKNELAKNLATAELQDMRLKADAEIVLIKEQSKVQLDEYAQIWKDSMLEIRNGTTGEFIALNEDLQTAGQRAMEGLEKGLKDKEDDLMRLARRIAKDIADTIDDALDINSPSRVTQASGGFIMDGLIVGMENQRNQLKAQAKTVAGDISNSLVNAVESFTMPKLEAEIQVETDVKFNDSRFDKLFGEATIPAPTTLDNARLVTRQNGSTMPSEPGGNISNTKEIKVEQTLNFHTKEMTPSEVARKNLQTSRQLVMGLGV